MKRPRTEESAELAPGENHGGSVDVKMVNGGHDPESKPAKETTNHVVVVGAGPGGLMLAYVLRNIQY